MDEKNANNIQANSENVSKTKTPKKKNKKIFIILGVIITILIIIAVSATAIITSVLPSLLEDNKKTEKKLSMGDEYGDATLQILDKDEISKYEKVTISFSDIDLDGIKELVVKYFNFKSDDSDSDSKSEEKPYNAIKIYKYENKQYINKINTGVHDINSKMNLIFAYNRKEKSYKWVETVTTNDTTKYYVLTDALTPSNNGSTNTSDDNSKDNSDNNSNENSKDNSDNKNNNSSSKPTTELKEIQKSDFESNYSEVETEQSPEITVTGEESDEELIELVKKALESYISSETMIENKTEIKVSKLDDSKELVYTVLEYQNYKYPAINLNSDDVKRVNNQIKKDYGFTIADMQSDEMMISELKEKTYEYYKNNNILSLLIRLGGNNSTWSETYNIDLDDYSEIKNDDLLKRFNKDKQEVIKNITTAADKYFDDDLNSDKSQVDPEMWKSLGYDLDIPNWKSELHDKINKLEQLYLNANGELCAIVSYSRPGGQWSCTRSIIVNIDKNYEVTRLSYTGDPKESFYLVEESKKTPTTTKKETTTTTTTTTKTETTSKNSVPDVNFDSSSSVVCQNGTYSRGEDGTLEITNSAPGKFNFSLDCTYMTAAGYPNMGMLEGTAKATKDGTFVYAERKSNGDYYDFNVVFKIDNDNTITVEEQNGSSYSNPYCGHNVVFRGTYKK